MGEIFLPQIIEDPAQIQTEINKIGAEAYAVGIMSPKGNFKAIKLKRVRTIAANIIKQEILARGGEAVLAYGALNHSIDETDVLLLGTLTQIESLAAKLRLHQFGLKDLAEEIKLTLSYYQNSPAPIKMGSKTFEFGRRTYIMGILNVTPDSFSDRGKFNEPDSAIKHALNMSEEGADIIDIGGESTRPGSNPISIEEEKKRIIPIIKELAKNRELVISIDTYKSEVASLALDAGASLVNDISGLRFDPKMAGLVAKRKVPLIVMHMRGTPKSMQENPTYDDLVFEILAALKESLEMGRSAGISKSNIMIDPGIGFG
jgi:dihydropteroate synthase